MVKTSSGVTHLICSWFFWLIINLPWTKEKHNLILNNFCSLLVFRQIVDLHYEEKSQGRKIAIFHCIYNYFRSLWEVHKIREAEYQGQWKSLSLFKLLMPEGQAVKQTHAALSGHSTGFHAANFVFKYLWLICLLLILLP